MSSASSSSSSSDSGSDASPASSLSGSMLFDVSKVDSYNESLKDSTPQQILEWAIEHLPNLYQLTAFGLTGVAAVDMISKISKRKNAISPNPKPTKEVSHLIPLIFIDTLYHFKETLALANKIQKRYNTSIRTYKPPKVDSTEEFEALYGDKLWESDEETYDYLVKVSNFLTTFNVNR